jgi:hypothetical protein
MKSTNRPNTQSLDDTVIELDESELAQVAGGSRPASADIHIVKTTDKASPILML